MWSDRDLQQASFRGIEFGFVDIEDGLKKSIAKFDYPYADGSDLEDMGLEARTVRLKAVFFGDKYENLEDFIEALKEQGFGYLNHPVFGSIKAVPETVSIRHDERAYLAEVDISFIEHLELAVSRVAKTASTALSDSGDYAAGTIEEANERIGDAVTDAGIPGDIPLTGLGGSGYLATISNYTSSVRSAMATVSSAVGTMQSYINQATEPFKLITSAVNYATDLPGTILSSIAGGIESVAGSYRGLLNAPGRFMDSLNYGLSRVERALGDFGGSSSSGQAGTSQNAASVSKAIKASWHVSKASALVTAAAIELAADETAEKSMRAPMNLKQFGSDASKAPTPMNLKQFGSNASVNRAQVMTMDEIDAVVATARSAISEAMDAVRAAYPDTGHDLVESLKKQALSIQEAGDGIRLRRERITDYEVPSDMPLHMLAFNLYGDIGEAERLLRINSIPNPNFLRAGEILRVYA